MKSFSASFEAGIFCFFVMFLNDNGQDKTCNRLLLCFIVCYGNCPMSSNQAKFAVDLFIMAFRMLNIVLNFV